MTTLHTRLTSLERWGYRDERDFQPESVAFIKAAGYNAVLVNGGSGIGPDMMTPESLVPSEVIPDLMPLTLEANSQRLRSRCELLARYGIQPWLCIWGVPGPDGSANSAAADSNRFFDRRTKLEMSAKLRRTPELFGSRNPATLSWRGNRPLCVSHPTVQAYYEKLFQDLVTTYNLGGIFFFPGDCEPEICDHTCERCSATGRGLWGNMIDYVNRIFSAIRQVSTSCDLRFVIWNQDSPKGPAQVQRFLNDLDPGIGLCMSLSDNCCQERRSGTMRFNQPWSNFAQPGQLFLDTLATGHQQGRSMMALAEISQSEVWDPVCHNLPHPRKTLDLLRHAESLAGIDSACDFWGNRSPWCHHANHHLMAAWLANPSATDAELLAQAARAHYALDDDALVEQALACWQAFDRAADAWALVGWAQRFSFAIGRAAARGRLYQALLPDFLTGLLASWGGRQLVRGGEVEPRQFARWQAEDCAAFHEVGEQFLRFSDAAGSSLARREGHMIQLAGELIASIGRTIHAAGAYQDADWATLRQIIMEEIKGREHQLDLSGKTGFGSGVDPVYVSEDLQNMRLYLSLDCFPEAPAGLFHVTANPFTV